MASANLFQQYLQPPRSVADYMGEMDSRDMRRAQLAGLQRSNSLADLNYQTQAQDIETKKQTQNALQRIYADPANANPASREQALLSNPLTASLGMAAQKQRLENANTAAQTGERNATAGKTEFETRIAKANKALSDIAALSSSEQAVASLQQHLAAGDIDQAKHDAVLRTIPQDPAQFPEWRKKMLMNILDAKTQLELTKPTVEFKSAGGSLVPVQTNAYAGPVGAAPGVAPIAVTQSPDNAATTATTRRGQDITDARQRETNAVTREGQQSQVINDPNLGIVIVNKGTKVAVPAVGADGKPIPSENAAKKTAGSKNALPVLDEADRIINDATGSYLGNAADKAVQTVGVATGGAKAIAKLKVLESNLMMSQPRMEGPQSDHDVMLYREAAGQIGNPNVPRDLKRAALETIRGIHERYAGLAPGGSKPTGAAFPDAAKEQRYQAWKASQGQ